MFLAESKQRGVSFVVKVLDFGIAKIVAEASTTRTDAIGTPLWMAPEQTAASASISPAADVWPLGLIAYRALTGKIYWNSANAQNSSAASILREVVIEPIEAASARAGAQGVADKLPAGFDGWFARCVEREPARRFPDATEALSAFEALAPKDAAAPATQPLPAPEPSPAERTAVGLPDFAAAVTAPGGPDPAAMAPTPMAAVATPPPRRAPKKSGMVAILAIGAAAAALAVGAATLSRGGDDTEAESARTSTAQISASAGDPRPSPSATGSADAGLPDEPDRGAIMAGIAPVRPSFQSCYQQALKQSPDLDGGTVHVTATIDPSGDVSSASTSGPPHLQPLSPCIVAAVKRAKFPPSKKGTTVSFPVVFTKS